MAFIPTLGSKYKSNSTKNFEPMKVNNFEVNLNLDLESIKKILRTSRSDKEGDNPIYKMIKDFDSTSANENLTLSVASVAAPGISFDPIEIPFGNNSLKYAGKPSFNDSEIVINDFIGNDTEAIILAWQSLIYDHHTQKQGFAYEYKKAGYLYEFDPQGGTVRKWELSGIWPSSVTFGDYNYDGGDRRQINMTLTMDYCERIPVE